jgi:anti-sigma B factor antagonist
LEISSRRDGTVVHVRVTGEIDMVTVDRLEEGLLEAITTPCPTVIVDFAEVTFCDSSGLAALDRAYAAAVTHGGRLRLVNLRPVIRRILELTGLLDTLTGP